MYVQLEDFRQLPPGSAFWMRLRVQVAPPRKVMTYGSRSSVTDTGRAFHSAPCSTNRRITFSFFPTIQSISTASRRPLWHLVRPGAPVATAPDDREQTSYM